MPIPIELIRPPRTEGDEELGGREFERIPFEP